MCGYCGCESVDVIGRFMREHVDIINANGDLRRSAEAEDPARVRAAVTTLRGLLDPHTVAEESGLFTVLAEDLEFTDHVHGLCGEHLTLGQRSIASRPARTTCSPTSSSSCGPTSTARRTACSRRPRSPSRAPSGSAVAGLTPEPAVVVPG